MSERTTSSVTSVLPVRLRRTIPRVAVGVVAATAMAVSGSGLVGAAVVDPDADAALLVVEQCVADVGPQLALVFTNAQGPGVANFHTTVDGTAIADVSVLPGAQKVVPVDVAEGSKPVVKVTANGGYSATITKGPINCWDMSQWVGFECTENGPAVVATGTNTGSLYDTLDIERNGVPWGAYGIEPGDTFDLVVPVAEDASYDVRVVPGHSGWSGITGYADCTPPADEPTPADDVPDETVDEPAPTTTTVTTVVTTPPAEVESTTAQAALTVATAPRFTG